MNQYFLQYSCTTLIIVLGLIVSLHFIEAEGKTSQPNPLIKKYSGQANSPLKLKPLESLVMAHPYKERIEVSIDWEKVITLSSKLLTIITNDPNSKNRYGTPNEMLQSFTDYLRQQLIAFEERYDVRVIWKTPDPNAPDVTAEFLKYVETYQCQKDMCLSYRAEEITQTYLRIVAQSDKLKNQKISK